MKTLNMILFVSIQLSVVAAGLLHNQIVWNVAIASIGAFALSGIICYISDLARESKIMIIAVTLLTIGLIIVAIDMIKGE